MKPNSIEELFGTLIECTNVAWRKHLKTDKYRRHMALDEFYKEMPEKVDDLIECWQGLFGKVGDYINLFKDSSSMTAIEYLEELHKMCEEGRGLLRGKSELESAMDDILQQIDSTLYKLKEFTNESYIIDLKDFLNESLEA